MAMKVPVQRAMPPEVSGVALAEAGVSAVAAGALRRLRGRTEIPLGQVRLSVLVPVYNEAATIAAIVEQVRSVPIVTEIICVNDCSTDDTRRILDRLQADGLVDVVIHKERNEGKGAAIRTALERSTGNIVVIQDADLEYDPADWPMLLQPIVEGRADAVYGSRFLGGPHRVLYFWHSVGNRLLTLLSNMFTNVNLTDMETCYKAIRGELARELVLTSNRFGFEPEITARLAQAKARLFEVPIGYSGRTYEDGKKITWSDGVAALWHIVRFNLFAPRTRPGPVSRARSQGRRLPHTSVGDTSRTSSGRLLAGWIAMLAAMAIIAFASAIKAPFEFDDVPSIRLNPSIRELIPIATSLAPPPNTSVSGRPVVNVSLAINYALNDWLGVAHDGPDGTIGYHVANILFHIACGLLLFGVVRRTLVHHANDDANAYWRDARDARAADGISAGADATNLAGVVALLWLLHPIQSEAVDYIIQRTELIVSACYLGTLYASIRAWESVRARHWWMLAGVGVCALGMGAKEVMISAPIMVLLYDRAFRCGSWRELWQRRDRRLFHVALVASAGIVMYTVLTKARANSVGFDLGITWYQYLYTQAWAITHYLELLIWPRGLTFDYGELAITGLKGVPGAALLTLLAIGTIACWKHPRRRWIGFLGLWFFLLLAPSSSVVPIKTEIAAERRVYLASAALFVLVVLGADNLRRRFNVPRIRVRLALAAVAAVLMTGTFVRGFTYQSSESLYRDVMAKAPENPRGYVGVGLALMQKGPDQAADARPLLERAVALDSNYAGAWQALGLVSLYQGEWQNATRSYRNALRLQADNPDAIDGMARALVSLEDADAAMPFVDRTGTRDIDLLYSLGALLVKQGRGALAIRYLEPATASVPHSLGLAFLSMAFAESAREGDAVAAAKAATAAAGDTSAVFTMAARAMLAVHRRDDALEYLRDATHADPADEGAKHMLDSLEAEILR